MSAEVPAGQNGKTILDIVPPNILDSLGYEPGRIQGSFMFFPQERPGEMGYAHVFDASDTRPNIVVLEIPTLPGALHAKDWYAGIIDGKKFSELEEEGMDNFRDQIKSFLNEHNRVPEEGIANILAAFIA